MQIKNVAESLAIIKGAFAPLRCVAETYDYGAKVRFRVFDGDNPVLSYESPNLLPLEDSRLLESVILAARSSISDRRYALRPWSFPDLAKPG